MTVRINTNGSPDVLIGVVSAYNVDVNNPVYDIQSVANFLDAPRLTFNAVAGGLIVTGLVRTSTDGLGSMPTGSTQTWGLASATADAAYRSIGGYMACDTTGEEITGFNFVNDRYNAALGVCLKPVLQGRMFQVNIID